MKQEDMDRATDIEVRDLESDGTRGKAEIATAFLLVIGVGRGCAEKVPDPEVGTRVLTHASAAKLRVGSHDLGALNAGTVLTVEKVRGAVALAPDGLAAGVGPALRGRPLFRGGRRVHRGDRARPPQCRRLHRPRGRPAHPGAGRGGHRRLRRGDRARSGPRRGLQQPGRRPARGGRGRSRDRRLQRGDAPGPSGVDRPRELRGGPGAEGGTRPALADYTAAIELHRDVAGLLADTQGGRSAGASSRSSICAAGPTSGV